MFLALLVVAILVAIDDQLRRLIDDAIAVVRGEQPGHGPVARFMAREQGVHTAVDTA